MCSKRCLSELCCSGLSCLSAGLLLERKGLCLVEAGASPSGPGTAHCRICFFGLGHCRILNHLLVCGVALVQLTPEHSLLLGDCFGLSLFRLPSSPCSEYATNGSYSSADPHPDPCPDRTAEHVAGRGSGPGSTHGSRQAPEGSLSCLLSKCILVSHISLRRTCRTQRSQCCLCLR